MVTFPFSETFGDILEKLLGRLFGQRIGESRHATVDLDLDIKRLLSILLFSERDLDLFLALSVERKLIEMT